MRIFLIDRYKNSYDIAKKLKENGIENIDIKEECKFKTTKNDIIILMDNSDYEGLSKTSMIILITKNKDAKFIWWFINTYNCIDVIDIGNDRSIILDRLIKRTKMN